MGYNACYGLQKNDDFVTETKTKRDKTETISFLCQDKIGNTTIKAEYRVNKKERPVIRTVTEQ